MVLKDLSLAMLKRMLEWARTLKQKSIILTLALKHPQTPWVAKVVGVVTVLYALSPIDLIPDFIPIFGHLDDLVIVPLGLWLAIKLIPCHVWSECETAAKRQTLAKPRKDWRGACIVALIWIMALAITYAVIGY